MLTAPLVKAHGQTQDAPDTSTCYEPDGTAKTQRTGLRCQRRLHTRPVAWWLASDSVGGGPYLPVLEGKLD